jgi:hypothetical protein
MALRAITGRYVARTNRPALGGERCFRLAGSESTLGTRVRATTPVLLLTAGLAAIALIFVADDPTWKAVWVGVASTAIAAGLVDGSALLESRRREGAILDIAGDRVGRIHQRLLWILNAVFEAGAGEAAELGRQLRESTQSTYDPARTADIMPPRTTAVWVAQCVADIDEALDVALALGAQTSQVARFVRLDALVRGGPFMTWLRNASSLPVRSGAENLAQQAADLLDSVQEEFQFFSDRDARGWKFGKL